MKTILLAVVAALSLTSLPVVHAQDSVNIERPRIQRFYMDAAEFRAFTNRYALSNGQEVVFKQMINLRYVQLDDGAYVRIYATSPKTFVTDSGVRFEFREGDETLAITDFAKLPLAKVMPGNDLMMASRR